MADQESPEFVMSQVKLAATYKAAGDLRQAISVLEQTLAGSQRALGADHLVTAAVRNDLAAAYRAAGELQRAVPLLERAVADAERTLGDEHQVTLAFRNNLAAAYQDTGLRREAPWFEWR